MIDPIGINGCTLMEYRPLSRSSNAAGNQGIARFTRIICRFIWHHSNTGWEGTLDIGRRSWPAIRD
jgi:hypothetical protein